jgi:hypothetical protein
VRALTICQPYAELIARGIKRVENRTWEMMYRGPLLIHAGKSRKFLSGDNYGIPLDEMDWGAVVAAVDVVACKHISQIETERAKKHMMRQPGDFPSHLEFLLRHEHVEGPFCIVFGNIRRLTTPIPFKGAQGIFNVPTELVREAVEGITI